MQGQKCEIQPEMDLAHPSIEGCGQSAHFLNVQINILDISNGTYETTKFDKMWYLLFPFVQYIQYKSNRAVKKSYNIVIFQLILILYMSSTVELALA